MAGRPDARGFFGEIDHYQVIQVIQVKGFAGFCCKSYRLPGETGSGNKDAEVIGPAFSGTKESAQVFCADAIFFPAPDPDVQRFTARQSVFEQGFAAIDELIAHKTFEDGGRAFFEVFYDNGYLGFRQSFIEQVQF